MSFKTIWDAIFTEVDKMRTADKVIWSVYNYDNKLKSESFPCIIITPTDWEEKITDSCTNQPTFNFSITLVDESSVNASDTEDNLRTLSDTLMGHLKDVTAVTLTNWVVLTTDWTYTRWRVKDQENMRVFQVMARYTTNAPK